ncbi:hypothetical protein Salat_2662700 [Sesamum alatum]|uniref:Uncharacterized protein n=1 Tax=Sesamum alatum TaxID=300844 RepID=A0AAE1XP88_9LAMI|nr:hypothetical protein Salat_2662700 [Sesamum alatum]
MQLPCYPILQITQCRQTPPSDTSCSSGEKKLLNVVQHNSKPAYNLIRTVRLRSHSAKTNVEPWVRSPLSKETQATKSWKRQRQKVMFKEVEHNDPIFVVNHDDALVRGLIVAEKVQEQNIGNKDKELASEDTTDQNMS